MGGATTTRFRVPTVALILAMTVAACGDSSTGDESGGLATLEEASRATTASSVEMTDEEAVLAFADCMRQNGLPDFQDPIVSPDGSIEFVGGGGDGTGERGDFPSALTACEDLLGEVTFTGGRRGDFDPIELEDELLVLAQCLRDNGLQADDPDISQGFGGNRDPVDGEEGTPRGPAALFGDAIDLQDPETQGIFEQCTEDVGFERPGGGGRGGTG